MTPEQLATILGSLAAVFVAVARCIYELRRYHAAVNSKMDRLLELTATSSHAEGKLEGQGGPAAAPGPQYDHSRLPSEQAHRGQN